MKRSTSRDVRSDPRRYRIRRQKPIPGGRSPLYVGAQPEIAEAVEHTARKFRVTRAFVQNTILGEYFGIPTEHFYEDKGGR